MARIPTVMALGLSLAAFQLSSPGDLQAQTPGPAGHEHLSEVACIDVPPGQKRPELGCFNIGTVSGLRFDQSTVYWYLREFPNRNSADAARSATGIVVEEDGRVWLSEFGARDLALRVNGKENSHFHTAFECGAVLTPLAIVGIFGGH